jgi:uncharacterized protein (TIGR02217 family)
MPVIESPIFPFCVNFGARFGPMFETDVVITDGGGEWRTVNREQPRQRGSVSLVARDSRMAVMRQWIYVAQGRARAFRVKDVMDYRVPDNAGIGGLSLVSGSTYQMQKWYSRGAEVFRRDIIKPTVGATQLWDVSSSGETLKLLGTHYTIDESTGRITISFAPAGDLEWRGTFETLMRFDVDEQEFEAIDRNIGRDEYIQGMDEIPLVEVLYP